MPHASDCAIHNAPAGRCNCGHLDRYDAQIGRELETAICMYTHFTGDPPYVGTDGLVLAVKETAAERDRFKEQVETLREALAIIFINARVIPDPTMNGMTDVWAVPLDDIEITARAALKATEPKP